MAATASSYSITMRLYTAPDHGVVGAVATAIASQGGVVTAIDVTESRHDRLVVDVTCSAADAEHSQDLVSAVDTVDGVVFLTGNVDSQAQVNEAKRIASEIDGVGKVDTSRLKVGK